MYACDKCEGLGDGVYLPDLYPVGPGAYSGVMSDVGGGNIVPYYPYGGGGSSSFWDELSKVLTPAAGILGTRYAVPQLNPGQYIQQTPQGSVMYQGNPSSTFGLPNFASIGGGSLGSFLPILLIGGVALLVLKK